MKITQWIVNQHEKFLLSEFLKKVQSFDEKKDKTNASDANWTLPKLRR